MATRRFTRLTHPPRWRRRSRVSGLVGLVALGAVSFPAASGSRAIDPVATRHSGVDPVCCLPDGRGPKRFSALIVTGKVSGGATVSMTILAPNDIGLVVARHVRGNLVGVVGVVPLGHQSAGLHRVPWNLNVNGSQLAAGTYDVLLEVLDSSGHPSGLLPSRRFAVLTISGSGGDMVRMRSLP